MTHHHQYNYPYKQQQFQYHQWQHYQPVCVHKISDHSDWWNITLSELVVSASSIPLSPIIIVWWVRLPVFSKLCAVITETMLKFCRHVTRVDVLHAVSSACYFYLNNNTREIIIPTTLPQYLWPFLKYLSAENITTQIPPLIIFILTLYHGTTQRLIQRHNFIVFEYLIIAHMLYKDTLLTKHSNKAVNGNILIKQSIIVLLLMK